MHLQTAQGEGGVGTGEADLGQFGGHRQLHGQEHRRCAIPLVGEADQMLAFEQCGAQLPGQRRDAFGRRVARGHEGLHAGQQPIDEAVEQGITIAHMPVDGGDCHAEIVGESPHRECVDAMTLHDAPGGAQHIVGGDRRCA